MSFSTNRTDRRSSPGRARAHDADTTGDREYAAATTDRRIDDDELTRATIDAPGDPPGYRMIVPVSGGTDVSEAERLVRAAAPIASERNGELLLVGLVVVPEQAALDQLPAEHPRYEAVVDATARLRRVAETLDVPARTVTCRTHREANAVLGAIERYDCDGVSMTIRPGSSQRRRLLSGNAVETIAARAQCDVFVEKPGTGADPPKRILLAVAGGPHSGLAAETARLLALPGEARVDIVHLVAEESGPESESESRSDSEVEYERARDIVQAAERALTDVTRVESDVSRTDRVAEALIERSGEYDVTVLGAPTRGLLTQFVFGTVPDSVKRRSERRVVMTKRNTGKTSVYDRWIAGDGTETTEWRPPPSRADETVPEETRGG